MNRIAARPAEGLRIERDALARRGPGIVVFEIARRGIARPEGLLATLEWSERDRRWTLAPEPRARLGGVRALWTDSGSSMPRHVPPWLRETMFAQLAEWGVEAARSARERESELLDRLVLSTSLLRRAAVALHAMPLGLGLSFRLPGAASASERTGLLPEIDGCAEASEKALARRRPL